MTARERLAPLAARLRAALADEKQRVNLLVCMGLAGLLLLAVSSWLPADSNTQSATPAAMTAARRTALWRPSRRPACSASPLSARAAAVLPCRAASLPWCRH